MEKLKIWPIYSKFWPPHLKTTWFLGSFRALQWDGLCQQRVPSQLKKPFVGEGRRGSHEQGNGRDLIQDLLKTWRLTLKLDSDHTWSVWSLPPGGPITCLAMWRNGSITLSDKQGQSPPPRCAEILSRDIIFLTEKTCGIQIYISWTGGIVLFRAC